MSKQSNGLIFAGQNFILVTRQNVGQAAWNLARGHGRILVMKPTYYAAPADMLTGDFILGWYDKPRIDPKQRQLSVRRGTKMVSGQSHQTNWENDREYRLLSKRLQSSGTELDQMSNWRKRLEIEDRYELIIGFQTGGCKVCNERDLTIFVPRSASPNAAFQHAFMWATNMWNTQTKRTDPGGFIFTSDHLEQMVKYVTEDLRTGEIFRYNIQAGIDADVGTEFAPR